MALLLGGLFYAKQTQAWNYGSGEQTGYIEAVQQEGFVWKNYHIFIKSSTDASQADKYCVHRNETKLIEGLKNASKTNKRITIEYNSMWYILSNLGRCGGDTIKDFSISEI